MVLVWSRFALSDREALFDYIAMDSPAAAVRVDKRIQAQVELLTQHPELGRSGRVKDTRELVIDRTPFVAVYQVANGAIRLLRILHGSQQWPPSP